MMDDENAAARIPLNQCKKVFIQRDYTGGLAVRFMQTMPPELSGKVEPEIWLRTMSELNEMYEKAEKIGARSACETLLGCFSCYISQLCFTGQYQQQLKRVASFLEEQNTQVYIPRGIFITDPIDRGLRVIEVSLLSERAAPRQQPGNTNTAPSSATQIRPAVG